jgi:hypothetical protein
MTTNSYLNFYNIKASNYYNFIYEMCSKNEPQNDQPQSERALIRKNPILQPGTRIETYSDLVINLDKKTRESLENKMNHLHDPEARKLNQVLDSFNSSPLSNSIWNDEEFPLYALKALKEDLIDGMDFSTSQLFYNVINHPKNKKACRFIPLFVGNTFNPEARKLIIETLKPCIIQGVELSKYEETIHNLKNDFMTGKQTDLFFNMMRQLNPIQQMFCLILEPCPLVGEQAILLKNNLLNKSVVDGINLKEPGFNVFNRLTNQLDKRYWRMIPSKGMMQMYLYATGRCSTLISQFGLASLDNLEQNFYNHERPMVLEFKYLDRVNQADGLPCREGAIEDSFHDCYHIDISSSTEDDLNKWKGMKRVIIENKTSERDSIVKNFYQFIDEKILDAEHVSYQNYRILKQKEESGILEEQAPECLFWNSINFIFRNSIEQFSLILKDPSLEKKDSAIFKQASTITKRYDSILKKLMETVINRADEYQFFYQLNLEFILNLDVKLKKLKSRIFSDVTYIFPLEVNDFQELKKMSKFSRAHIDELFKNKSKEGLINYLKNSKSYLIRNRARKLLRENYNININQLFDLLKTIKLELQQTSNKLQSLNSSAIPHEISSSYSDVLDFIVKDFRSVLYSNGCRDQKEIFEEVRACPIPHYFEYLIKSAVLENDIKKFNLTIGDDSNFIGKQINHRFSDGLTLLQTARHKGNQEMIHYLIHLGAKEEEGLKQVELNSSHKKFLSSLDVI